jgi:hypothetical protein
VPFNDRRLLGCLFATCCYLVLSTGSLAQMSLDAKDWQTRSAALAKIDTTVATQDSALQAKLMELLKRENQTVKSSLEHSGGKEGVSVTLGEGYSEYYSKLYATVFNIAKKGSDSALPILADGAFNTDSETATLLVDKWRVTLPIFLQNAQVSHVGKAQSLGMLARIANTASSGIPPDQLSSIKDTMRLALSDQDPGVRIAAVQSTAEAGFAEFLPTLQKLATRDPAHVKSGGKVHYPVREEAAKAAQHLNQQ